MPRIARWSRARVLLMAAASAAILGGAAPLPVPNPVQLSPAQANPVQVNPVQVNPGPLNPAPAAGNGAQVPNPRNAARPAPPPQVDQDHHFELRGIQLIGAKSLSTAQLSVIWRPDIGKSIPIRRIYAIADAIGAAYAAAGYALYTVSVPNQPFGDAPVRIVVVEGSVAAATIDGDTKAADLSLVNAAVARIEADKPLRQATLERNILLINAIPGLTANSRVEPLSGHPGSVRLHLSIHRKPFEEGIGVNNQGSPVLARIPLSINAAANSVLHQGDRTQLVFGFPSGFARYQYYGLTHVEPLGTDGATVTVSLGDLATRPYGSGADGIGGNAVIGDLQVSDPLILAVKQTLTATANLDFLDSNNAVFGTTFSDERTRAARLGLSYARQDGWDGIDAASVTVSEGIDLFGARRGNVAFGGPDFTKASGRIVREQPLPDRFVLRLRTAWQATGGRLPASEDFTYGGPDFGQGFPIASLFGDEGIATLGEVAWKLPDGWQPKWLGGAELFTSGDWAKLWNLHTPYALPTEEGASAGAGLRGKLLGKVTAQVELARIVEATAATGMRDGWNVVFLVTGSF